MQGCVTNEPELFSGPTPIERIRGAETLAELQPFFDSSDDRLRLESLRRLEEIEAKSEDKGSAASALLEDSEISVQRKAIDIVGKTKHQPSQEQLTKMFDEASPEIRKKSAEALKNFGRKGKEILVQKAVENSKEEPESTDIHFQETGLETNEIREILLEEEELSDEDVVHIADEISGSDETFIPYYVGLEEERNPEAFYDRLIVMGKRAVGYSIDYLYRNMDDADYLELNSAVIRYFALVKDRRTVPVLRRLSTHENPELRNLAKGSLVSVQGY